MEEADGGTLFLDEIGEMPVDLQAKLLRVLESGEFIKVGETKPTKVNMRVIAATNRDLPAEIAAGNFREDLYYRLSVFQIKLPSLGERPSDIDEYARHFTNVFAAEDGQARRNDRARLPGAPAAPSVAPATSVSCATWSNAA